MIRSATNKTMTAFIAVGANMNDPLANCRRGVAAIDALPGCRITGQSRWYRTAPVGFDHPDWFVNGAVRIDTILSPLPLLDALLAIETAMGRVRTDTGIGPRPLDLDLVLFGDRVQNTPRLSLPHPRMHKRRFVLQPICDIDPVVVHPGLGSTARDLLAAIHDPDQTISPI